MDNKILLQDLAQAIANRTSSSKKDADNFVRNVFDIVIQYLQEDKIVKIKGLGTFKVIEVSGRDSVNVNTGERIHISGHSKISFSPDNTLRDQVNRPFADFETVILNDNIDIAEMEYVPEEETETLSQQDEPMDDTSMESAQPAEVETEAIAEDQDTQEVELGEPATGESLEQDSPTEAVDEDVVEPVSDPVTEEQTMDNVAEKTADETEEQTTATTEDVPVANSDNPIPEIVEEGDSSVSETEHFYTSSKDSTENSQVAEKETIVVTNNRPCKFCCVCYVLLTLAMMALSYIAGVQEWFVKEKAPAKNVELVEKPSVPAKSATVDADSTQTAADSLNRDSETKQQKQSASEDAKPSVQVSSQSTQPGSETSQKPAQEAVTKPVSGAPVASANDKTAAPNQYPDGKYEIVGTKCTHTLKSGEGLYRLARTYYGNKNMATYIISYNHIANPDIVSVGTVLKIPELRRLP